MKKLKLTYQAALKITSSAAFLIASLALLSSCAAPTKRADTATLDLKNHTIDNTPFSLAVWQKWQVVHPKTVRIYIEGDGNAYVGKGMRSPNPTPRHPVALLLAKADNTSNVLYMGRPCQYAARKDNICQHSEWWTTKRFDPLAINAMEKHIRALLPASITTINWVGFSGGATYALALAPRFKATASIRTVAGNLNPNFVHAWYKATPMPGAIAPLSTSTSTIPQLHFVGNADKVITPELQQTILSTTPQHCSATYIEAAEHTRGWQELWPELLHIPLPTCTPL